MRNDSMLFGLTIVAVFAGLGMVLGGEWFHARPVVYAGGAVVLGAIGVMTGALMRMKDPEGAESGH